MHHRPLPWLVVAPEERRGWPAAAPRKNPTSYDDGADQDVHARVHALGLFHSRWYCC